MSIQFNPHLGLILVNVAIEGPSGTAILRLALDTGATSSLVNVAPLVALGYDPSLVPKRVQVTTGTGIEFVARINLNKLTALGQVRINFPILCHTIPPTAGVDGLLGLDFFRGHILSLDFKKGCIVLF